MPKERILYILGAGFSAPLGLPVMRDFLIKARDQHAIAPERFAHFPEVFRLVDSMATVKNFYEADLFNIEEVLSILEMQAQVSGSNQRKVFTRFIEDVIQYYTPTFADPGDCSASNYDAQLVNVRPAGSYICFVASLFQASIIRHQAVTGPGNRGRFSIQKSVPTEQRYSVLTLNYDVLLEEACGYLGRNADGVLAFATRMDPVDPEWDNAPYLAKLHGSVGTGTIIPPTWSKGIDDEIRDAWRLAHELLSGATSLRIIGYSLPPADAYVRYLLKSAVLTSQRLKSIDILCMDSDGSVRARYESFLRFPNCQFRSGNAGGYLSKLVMQPRGGTQHPESRLFAGLEGAHERYFDEG